MSSELEARAASPGIVQLSDASAQFLAKRRRIAVAGLSLVPAALALIAEWHSPAPAGTSKGLSCMGKLFEPSPAEGRGADLLQQTK